MYIDAPAKSFNDGLGISFYHVLSRKSVGFPAFITAFNETFNCDWNTQSIYGRADPVHTYKNTKRAITIGFKMPAASANGAYGNLKSLQRFLQFLYPGYEKVEDRINNISADNLPVHIRERAYQQAGLDPHERNILHDGADRLLHLKYKMKNSSVYTIAQSPLVRLKVMNLTQDRSQYNGETFSSFFANAGVWDPSRGLLGYIKNVSISHNLETDVGVVEGAGSGFTEPHILPKLIDVTVDFVAIHEHHLGWNPISSQRAAKIRSTNEEKYADTTSGPGADLEYATEGEEEYVFHSPYGLKRGRYEAAWSGVRDYSLGDNPWIRDGDYPTLEHAIADDIHNRSLLPDINNSTYSYGPEPGSAAADAQRAQAAANAASVKKGK
mgnify:CR=1 FL=1|tara:strand:- start:8234 stop:9379 length:1146 start_codon:yes stop_codon:yes gene_type:complete